MDDQDVVLSSPIKVSNGGSLDDCQSVILVCPVKKFIRKTYKLQQYFTKAQTQAVELYAGIIASKGSETDEDETDEDEDSKMTGDQVMQMLLASSVDMELVFEEFERLAMLGAVKYENQAGENKKLNAIQWDAITEEDKEGLMVKYMAFFIRTLALKSFK